MLGWFRTSSRRHASYFRVTSPYKPTPNEQWRNICYFITINVVIVMYFGPRDGVGLARSRFAFSRYITHVCRARHRTYEFPNSSLMTRTCRWLGAAHTTTKKSPLLGRLHFRNGFFFFALPRLGDVKSFTLTGRVWAAAFMLLNKINFEPLYSVCF